MSRIALLTLVGCVLALPAWMTIAMTPQPDDGPLLVLHPPWVDGAAAIRRAGGWPVGLSDTRIAAMAAAGDHAAFRTEIRAQGAWAVLADNARSTFCSP